MVTYLTIETREAYRNGMAYAFGVRREYGVGAMIRRVRDASSGLPEVSGERWAAYAAGAIDAALDVVQKAKPNSVPRVP